MARRSTKRPRPPKLPRALWPHAQRLLHDGAPCLLCGHPGTVLGIFLPDEPQRWGFPPGFHAGRLYLLCQPCLARPDKAAAAEAILWQERQAVMAGRWN